MNIWKGYIFEIYRVLYILNEHLTMWFEYLIFSSLFLKFWEMLMSFNVTSSSYLCISNGSNPNLCVFAGL